jgi:hypothetical protein
MPPPRNTESEPDDMDRDDSLDQMGDEPMRGERGRADDEDEDEFDPTSRGDENGEVM